MEAAEHRAAHSPLSKALRTDTPARFDALTAQLGRYTATLRAMPSIASQTVEAARLFLTQAANTHGGSAPFRYNLEAALVFARTISFHVQKRFGHCAGFDDWYTSWQARLSADGTCRYCRDKRNFVLKEGHVALRYTMHVEASVFALCGADVTMSVIRADGSKETSSPSLSEPRPSHDVRPARERRASAPTISFADHRPDVSAIEVVTGYVDVLARLVEEAEARFSECAPAV